ncbi:hypothetical protein [Spirosoma oryzicola]|uniref:hypothetical protein n=1 Tax=Spirosoma oryzicola TaxID=2898794 RepID=UPI001E3A54B8|nr:hypothetical protein [Spirosoma oryzicola]UHG93451.1 hypothetical protein LQ777_11215 [Spirosoma oryzicola]
MTPSPLSTFTIPVYPLVLKFLSSQYNTEPFTLGGYSNPYAGFLYNSLDRYCHFDTRLPRKYSRLTAELTIGIPAWVQRYGAGAKLTPQKISVFNDFVRQMFFEKMAEEVTLRMSYGMGIKASVERFLNRYGITEEELSLQTALRYYARNRRSMCSGSLAADSTPVMPIDCCPVSPDAEFVILPHERDSTQWQMESGRRQVA